MAEPAAATQLTALDDAALDALYRHPDPPGRWWLRVGMITSLDGATALDGRSGALGGDGDRRVFAALRAAADVVLVGGATVRAEGYTGVRVDDARRAARRRDGRAEVPPLAIVTASGDLPADAPALRDTEVRPLVFCRAAAVDDTRERLGPLADVLSAGSDRHDDDHHGDADALDPAAVLAALGARGLRRVLCEGGPHLTGRLVAAGLVDELCLTVAPLLTAGPSARLTGADTPAAPTPMRRSHLLTDDTGALYSRWTRASRPTR